MVALDRERLIRAIAPLVSEAAIEDDVLRVRVTLAGTREVELLCALPASTFYSMPEFVVGSAKYPELFSLPHVGWDGKVCAFDASVSFPNPSKPIGALVEALGQTIKVLNDGLAGENANDYSDELLAYWSLGAKGIAFVFDCPACGVSRIGAAYSRLGGTTVLCVATSGKGAAGFARRLGNMEKEPSTFEGLFLRLDRPLSFPLPRTCAEWGNEIAKSGSHKLGAYKRFIAERSGEKKSPILLSAPTAMGRALSCFLQPAISHAESFRKNEVRYDFAIKALGYGDLRVDLLNACDSRQTRLFSRGGDGKTLDGSYAIIGCGSLGSNLAKLLADCGARKFSLIDNDSLGVENVARHACGFQEVGQKKVDALKALLENSNPNIECKAIAADANKVLDERPVEFSRQSAIFLTAADLPLEFHFVDSLVQGRIEGCLVIMWLEPFAFAAHALLLNKPQDIINDLFDDNLSFDFPVIANESSFTKREAGCQSSYMPYSGVDVQSFILDFLRIWRDKVGDAHNYHYVWFGNLSAAERVGAMLSCDCEQEPDYSSRLERID